jgi:hypothetical protein
MQKKHVVLALFISVVGLPAMATAGSLTFSLIQGKAPSEAVKILAEQIDSTLVRLSLIEAKQTQLEETIAEVETTVETVQASSTVTQEATASALEDTAKEVEALKAELEQERQKDLLEAEKVARAAHCEDLKWAKNMPGKVSIENAYTNALAQVTTDALLVQLKQDYEYEVNDLIEDSPDHYSDYNDPERIEYCEANKTTKCQTTLHLAEAITEETAWYKSEKDRLSSPNAKEYVRAKELASRLKPQYDEYLANCQ